MNINELEEVAKAATPGPWKLSGTEHVVAGGNYVVALDCRPEDAAYIAAANPSAIRELIAAYRVAVAALDIAYKELRQGYAEHSAEDDYRNEIVDCALSTAKRLGIGEIDADMDTAGFKHYERASVPHQSHEEQAKALAGWLKQQTRNKD